jgi:hypothetical protein
MKETDYNVTINLNCAAEQMRGEIVRAIKDKRHASIAKRLESNSLNDKLKMKRFEDQLSRFERAMLLLQFEIEDTLETLK